MSQWHGVVATAAAVVVVIASLDVLLASTAAAAAVTPAHAQHPDTLVRNAAAGVRGFGRLTPVSPEAAAGAVKKARAMSLLELGVALVGSDGSPDRRTLALAHGDDIDAAVAVFAHEAGLGPAQRDQLANAAVQRVQDNQGTVLASLRARRFVLASRVRNSGGIGHTNASDPVGAACRALARGTADRLAGTFRHRVVHALEDLYCEQATTSAWREGAVTVHIEFVVGEDRVMTVESRDTDNVTEVARAACAWMGPASASCARFVTDDLVRNMEFVTQGTADVPPRAVPAYSVPPAHESPLRTPQCLLLSDGFGGDDGGEFSVHPVHTPVGASSGPPGCDAVAPSPAPAPTPAAPVRVFAVIVHYDHRDKAGHIATMLQRFDDMRVAGYTVTVVVTATEPLPALSAQFPMLSIRVHVLDRSLGVLFGEASRQLLLDASVADAHDVFVFSEDDCDVTVNHVDAFRTWSQSRVTPADWIVGFTHYEEFEGAKHVVSATLKHNYAYSVYSYGGRQYLTTKNPHQAGFMCTRAQLQMAVSSGCMQRHQQPHWRFPELDNTDSELYYRCGLQKVTPVACLDRFLLHHMPNKYVHMSGIADERTPLSTPNPARGDRYPLTTGHLHAWLRHDCPAASA